MAKKLYQLEITYTAYVMAEDPEAAEDRAYEVVGDGDGDVRASLVYHHNRISWGWDKGALVYGTDEETTLGSVWPTEEAEKEAERAAADALRQTSLLAAS